MLSLSIGVLFTNFDPLVPSHGLIAISAKFRYVFFQLLLIQPSYFLIAASLDITFYRTLVGPELLRSTDFCDTLILPYSTLDMNHDCDVLFDDHGDGC